ncbi:hypothetical protein BSKO_00620 [Bryopsis sp. KO-2023]|nr:hypothetical protein BSKO_00620 [Bryopsis sp. KO-2023]
MSQSPSSGDLRSAIVAACNPDPTRQQQANAWLTQYAETNGAWEGALELLRDNDDQIRFFSANILLTKTRTDWSRLSGEAKQHLLASVNGHVEAMVRNSGVASVVVARLCLLLASMSVLSGVDVLFQFLTNAIQFAPNGQNGALVSLSMLRSVPEEAEKLDITQQRNVAQAMQSKIRDLLGIVASILANSQQGNDSIKISALQCFIAWLKLGYSLATVGQSPNLSLSMGKVEALQAGLLGGLLSLLCDKNEAVGEAASEALAQIIITSVYEDSSVEKAALGSCVGGLCRHKSALLAENDSGCARNVARVAAALAEAHLETLCESQEQVVKLSELVLGCMKKSDMAATESVLDFFLAVNEVPVSERHPQLRGPAFEHLLSLILERSCYPGDFQNWEDCWIDEHSFHRFRNENLAEGLDMCFGILSADSTFQRFFARVLNQPTSWQVVEAAVFCLKSVGPEMIRTLERSLNAGQAVWGVDLIREVIRSFGATEGPIGQFMSNPWLIQTAASVIGSYVSWLAKQEDPAPLQTALRFLLGPAMAVKEGRISAAKSFHILCIHCSSKLANTSTVHSLSQAVASLPLADPRGSAEGLTLEERIPLMEGLSRLAAQLDTETASALGCKLVEPMLAKMGALSQKGSVSAADAGALSAELQLVSTVVRFLEGKGTPAVKLVQGIWGDVLRLLEIPHWIACEDVVDAVLEFFQRSFLACQAAILPQLPNLLSHVASVFESRKYKGCLDMLSKATELYGRSSNAGLDEIMGKSVNSVCGALAGVFQNGELASQAELVASLFSCMDNYLLFSPTQLLSSPAFPKLLEWSVAGISLKERDSVKSSLAFLTHVLNPGQRQRESPERKQYMPMINEFVAKGGKVIVERVLWSACGTCPRHLLRSVASLLRNLTENSEFGPAALQWTVDTVWQAKFLESFGNRLTQDDCKAFCELLTGAPRLPGERFELLVVDFVSIPRGEGPAEALLAYQF